MSRKVPLVVLKDGEPTVVGEAIIDRDGMIRATIRGGGTFKTFAANIHDLSSVGYMDYEKPEMIMDLELYDYHNVPAEQSVDIDRMSFGLTEHISIPKKRSGK